MHRLFRPAIVVVALLLVGNGVALATRSKGSTYGISLKVVAPEPGDRVPGNTFLLDVRARGVSFDKPGRATGLAAFIDGKAVAPGAFVPARRTSVRMNRARHRIFGGAPGQHTVTVVAMNDAKRRVGAGAAKTTFKLLGPALTVQTADRRFAANKPIHLTFGVFGASLPGAKSKGPAAHIHLFVDHPPPPPGTASPPGPDVIDVTSTEADIGPLPPGRHRVWAVLADAQHNTLRPSAMDLVSFIVQ